MITSCSSINGKIRFGTAGSGGIYSDFGNAFATVASNEYSDLSFDVKNTAGSTANIRLISDNYLQLAIAQADVLNDAYYGEGDFKSGDKYQGYSAIAGLYTEACHIIVRNDSNIHSISDLQGKKVGVGEKESGTEHNAYQILSANGLSSNMINPVNLDYAHTAEQLENNAIDAMFCTAGIDNTVVGELAKQADIRFLEIDETAVKRLTDTYNFYTEYSIPSGTYKGLDHDIKTLGVRSVLIASDKLPEDTVEKITKVLFEHSKELQFSISSDLDINKDNALDGVTIPFHKGAIKYYNSIGIDTSK